MQLLATLVAWSQLLAAMYGEKCDEEGCGRFSMKQGQSYLFLYIEKFKVLGSGW
jgi:hypothetical protein